MDAKQILKLVDEEGVRFLRLQFTDVMGVLKNVEIPRSQFEKALENEIMFDGSSIQGFTRIEESDMLLFPDLDTFQVNPWSNPDGSKVARLICDVHMPDGSPFAGCPRMTLKRQVERARKMGYDMVCGPEAEFFLFNRDAAGDPLVSTHDVGGYFDLTPVDRGEEARRDIVILLEAMGFEVEAAHHEVAPGQHEIDFKYAKALESADNVATFRFVVKKVALDYGLHATFMPKPIFGVNGSGMHTHQSLLTLKGKNAFHDKNGRWELSEVALQYIGGILAHATAFVAITNPLVNSYKRLVPGYEAPVNVAWSEKNRSPLVRVPAKRGMSTRCEVRMPDPACNPYLAFAVMLACRPRRHRERPRRRRAGEQEHLHHEPAREAAPEDRPAPGQPVRGARQPREGQGGAGRPGRAHLQPLPRGEARGVGRLHLAGPPLGDRSLPHHLLTNGTTD